MLPAVSTVSPGLKKVFPGSKPGRSQPIGTGTARTEGTDGNGTADGTGTPRAAGEAAAQPPRSRNNMTAGVRRIARNMYLPLGLDRNLLSTLTRTSPANQSNPIEDPSRRGTRGSMVAQRRFPQLWTAVMIAGAGGQDDT
ncbi:hypothetical protein Are01nite_50450 [Actinoplanes regularis]|nr:hypothetical protein Are01nite_50450 [Actinoplanes regularis]